MVVSWLPQDFSNEDHGDHLIQLDKFGSQNGKYFISNGEIAILVLNLTLYCLIYMFEAVLHDSYSVVIKRFAICKLQVLMKMMQLCQKVEMPAPRTCHHWKVRKMMMLHAWRRWIKQLERTNVGCCKPDNNYALIVLIQVSFLLKTSEDRCQLVVNIHTHQCHFLLFHQTFISIFICFLSFLP